MDFNSLTPEQKQAVICSNVIQNYTCSILNSSSVSAMHSESEALVKVYACFLLLDNAYFHREEAVHYQCLAQLAGTFDDYKKYSYAISDTVNRYIASWKSRQIRFLDDPNANPTVSDLPILLAIVSEDLAKSGYSIEPSLISQYALQYFDDFSVTPDAKSGFSPAESSSERSSEDIYSSQISAIFDELESRFADFPGWSALRKIALKHLSEHPFPNDPPAQYAIETIIYTCILLFQETRMFDSSGLLSDTGRKTYDFVHDIGDYGVKNGYVSKDKVLFLYQKLTDTINNITSTKEKSSPQRPESSNKPKKPSLKVFHGNFLLILFVLLGVIVCFLLFTGTINDIFPSSSSSTSTSSVQPSAAASTPQPKPSTGMLWHRGTAEELAPFDVTASGNKDYVLLLVQDGKAMRSYYIRHGETLSVLVPLGTYQVYYACATIQSAWHGRTDLWGTHTEFYKSQKILDFELEDGYYYGYTLELSVSSSVNTESAYESSADTWNSLF